MLLLQNANITKQLWETCNWLCLGCWPLVSFSSRWASEKLWRDQKQNALLTHLIVRLVSEELTSCLCFHSVSKVLKQSEDNPEAILLTLRLGRLN